jgi:hypothetical protein
VDAFWRQFEPLWEQQQVAAGRRRRRATRLHPSEIMTSLILFQQSGYSICKGFYTHHMQTQLCADFPHLVSYTRFVDLMPRMVKREWAAPGAPPSPRSEVSCAIHGAERRDLPTFHVKRRRMLRSRSLAGYI